MKTKTDQRFTGKDTGEILQSLARCLAHSQTPRLDAQVLLAHLTGKSRSWVLAHPEMRLFPEQQEQLVEAVDQLEAGIPLPYVLGSWEFYNLSFRVNPTVLIPRPETELLVEAAISWLRDHPSCRRVADIGTGSGCIAVSIAINVLDAQITATDISEAAITLAGVNAAHHNVAGRIAFYQADLLNLPPLQFNLICANLPYIPTNVLTHLAVFGAEPTLALDGGPDGLKLIRVLIRDARSFLYPGGLLLVEIEATQGKTAIELAQAHFPDAKVSLQTDLAGIDRLLRIQT